MPEELNLSNLKPASRRKDRKRVGRGMGSGKGRYAGRGIKGQKARSGSHKMRAGFEGGQMPIYMRLGKQRGGQAHMGPVSLHRTYTAPVNVRDLDRFDDGAEVTLEALVEAGLIRNTKTDVKILGHGDLKKKLSVTAHFFSASAREKIEAAGGSVTQLKEPKERKQRRQRPAPPEQAAEKPAEAPEPEAEAKPEEPEAD